MPLESMITEAELQAKISELGVEIDRDFATEPVLLVGILKGSVHFLSDLARRLKIETSLDFMQVSSYGIEKSSSGIVQIRKDLDTNIEGLNVIIVEDIVDTGLTLNYLSELLSTRNPKTLRVACLLSKPAARKVNPIVHYVGFEIPNEFVVGYGLDYGERYRNLPYIAIFREG